jgi:hypothetical protein
MEALQPPVVGVSALGAWAGNELDRHIAIAKGDECCGDGKCASSFVRLSEQVCSS